MLRQKLTAAAKKIFLVGLPGKSRRALPPAPKRTVEVLQLVAGGTEIAQHPRIPRFGALLKLRDVFRIRHVWAQAEGAGVEWPEEWHGTPNIGGSKTC